ncbi:WXG100 family type VII secretion target [Streptomyces sp. NPDC019224]|uniref:WXG100 family type VII secretion target n=1 Tax=Streptomyces sp. NPDC019224 TaxID=3154484 RepID=UPI0033E00A5C
MPSPPSPGDFLADLAQLREAIGTVNGCHQTLEELTAQVDKAFSGAEDVWHSRAGTSFAVLHTDFDAAMRQLFELLAEMAVRMQSAYDTYHEAELQNTVNVTA